MLCSHSSLMTAAQSISNLDPVAGEGSFQAMGLIWADSEFATPPPEWNGVPTSVPLEAKAGEISEPDPELGDWVTVDVEDVKR
jgi:hypothetical protein